MIDNFKIFGDTSLHLPDIFSKKNQMLETNEYKKYILKSFLKKLKSTIFVAIYPFWINQKIYQERMFWNMQKLSLWIILGHVGGIKKKIRKIASGRGTRLNFICENRKLEA